MNGTIWFDENGSEYTGYFRALNVKRFSFDPAHPMRIELDGIRIELDENINGIEIDGEPGRLPLNEPWTKPWP